ncbi:MAG TPA: energy transducer TonB [Candidatus Polarisedimenticolaceae bacterium]|nr:energy transducer TonB [Candidatus Polarisedimenticolaceae bacterium]
MKRTHVLALAAAVLVHGAILLFGGLLLFHPKQEPAVAENVDILDAEAPKEAPKKEQEPEPEPREADEDQALRAEVAAAPDLTALAGLESDAAPALEPLNLSALEGALDAATSGEAGAFAESSRLVSGGRIGGTGTAGPADPGLAEVAFSIGELDQRPRPIFQSPPRYPLELRRQKVTGTVQVVFLVDRDGRVLEPKVEKSTNAAFDTAALDAVRQWRFEAGTRGGQKVPFKMRVPITFNAS